MLLKIIFSRDNPIKPRVFVEISDKHYEIKRERWIQFVTFLSYRRLTGLEEGWVNLKELSGLSAFNHAKSDTIGKYLVSSLYDLQLEITKFINTAIDVNTKGPFIFKVAPKQIITDLPRLERYITIINLSPFPEQQDCQSLWQAARLTLDKYELRSSTQITQTFLNVADSRVPNYQPPLAHIHIAWMEYLKFDQTLDYVEALGVAEKLVSDIKSIYERRVLGAYINYIKALHLESVDSSYELIKELHRSSLEDLSKIKKNTPDKLCLSGHIHYHGYITDILHHPDDINSPRADDWDTKLKLSFDLYRQFFKKGIPQLIEWDKGLIEGKKLHSDVVRRFLSGDDIGENEIERYHKLINGKITSRLLTLNIAAWIRRYFTDIAQYQEAHKFCQECLIDHVDLHETRLYHELADDQKRLKGYL
ncbi:MAG: hypothetical protein HN356_00680 [Calditrichaeota bacterium]|jgi:hypothetical protein|nr:hypothetical protein [Calditrichota bacterium]MBT7616928.1 hypothetical protein [Calditrichota bacterium]MBT7788457.1 hypothetical protein [Calditrichota bacterium]